MGDRGPMGLQGPPGKDGLAYRPDAYAACSLLLDLVAPGDMLATDGITETLVAYTFTRYDNDDLGVNCEAGLGSQESASGGLFFPSITPGASSGICVASVDYPPFTQVPGNVGAWHFEMVGVAIRATYRDDDAGHPLNGRSWSMGENDCHSFQMSAANQWRDAALSDVL